MTTSDYNKPLPHATLNPEVSRPFWEGAKKHELWIQYCTSCNKYIFFPREVCPHNCLAPPDKLLWTKVSGRGRVYSYTTVYQSSIPSFSEEAPYIHATIQLDEGARMTGNVIVSQEQLAEDPGFLPVGQRVQAVFDDVTDDVTLVKWEPIPEDEAPGVDGAGGSGAAGSGAGGRGGYGG